MSDPQDSSSRSRLFVSADDVEHAFRSAQIESEEVVMVHSGLWKIGLLDETEGSGVETFYDGIRAAVGPDGTIAVPSGNRSYGAENAPFDVHNTPPGEELGVFSAYVTARSDSRRSLNPVAGIAAIGPKAEWLCGGQTGSSFGVDSPYERLHVGGGKIAFVGIDLWHMTFIHYVEYRVGVPHLYSKLYPTGITDDGVAVRIPISGQVRYLDYDIQYRLDELTSIFDEAGLLTKAALGVGQVLAVDVVQAFEFMKKNLQRDFSFLLQAAPKFVKGQIPLDGATDLS